MPETPRPDEAIIFVNYRRTDAAWPAEHIATQLAATFGRDRVFLDARAIDAGDDFEADLESQLQRATAMLVLIGPNWLGARDKFDRRRLDREDDWVRREIRLALAKEGCRVIPVLVDDATLPDDTDALPADISALLTRQRITVRQTTSDRDIEAVSRVLEKDGFRRVARRLGETMDAQKFTDPRVKDVVAHLRQLHEDRGTQFLPMPDLLPELDLLFARKTFRYEALRSCSEQRWADRLDSAYQTSSVLQSYMRNVMQTAPDKYPVYRDLVDEVEGYCMQMGALLFDPPVDVDRIEKHIGRTTFKGHLPRAKRFPVGRDKQPRIADAINDTIERHRVRAVQLMDQLLRE